MTELYDLFNKDITPFRGDKIESISSRFKSTLSNVNIKISNREEALLLIHAYNNRDKKFNEFVDEMKILVKDFEDNKIIYIINSLYMIKDDF